MNKATRSHVVSSFPIVKGSMIDDTYRVFRDGDFDLSRDENLRRMRETNSIGAASDSWLINVSKVLHRRFNPNYRDRPLVVLAKARVAYSIWKPALLWHLTRDEFLLRDFLTSWLFPAFQGGVTGIRVETLFDYLQNLEKQGHVTTTWTESTLKRVASALLRIAVDFDLMAGSQVREFLPYNLSDDAFLYLLHALADHRANAYDLVHDEDWRLFLMKPEDVERELFRLHQFHRLGYETAGTLAQLSLPCNSALAYARELAP